MARLSEKKKALVESMMRESLLAAAEELLTQEGWKGATMERLAQAVGIAKGTVYNYFRDKRELLWAVVERNTAHLRHLAASLDVEKGDPVALLAQVLEEALWGFHRDRHVIAALIQAYHEDRELDPDCTAHHHRHPPLTEVRDFVRKVIARGAAEGVFRPVDPVLGEALINAVLIGLAKQFTFDKLDFPGERFIEAVKTILLQGLCAHGAASAEAPGTGCSTTPKEHKDTSRKATHHRSKGGGTKHHDERTNAMTEARRSDAIDRHAKQNNRKGRCPTA
jgi:AcrR family transcriptional regulator